MFNLIRYSAYRSESRFKRDCRFSEEITGPLCIDKYDFVVDINADKSISLIGSTKILNNIGESCSKKKKEVFFRKKFRKDS